MRTTPDRIESHEPNQILVFGSNRAGRHGKGLAKFAMEHFGAQYGVGNGLTGQCYALPTRYGQTGPLRTLRIHDIASHVTEFATVARANPDKTFLVTEIGCGLAGYTPAEIAPLFKCVVDDDNVWLPARFWEVLKDR